MNKTGSSSGGHRRSRCHGKGRREEQSAVVQELPPSRAKKQKHEAVQGRGEVN